MHPLTLAIALVTVLSAIAQPSTDTPARRPQGPPSSPEIHDDRKVTFRLRAPNASEVKVSGEWGGEAAAMSKDEPTLTINLAAKRIESYFEREWTIHPLFLLAAGAIALLRYRRTLD